MSDPELKRGSIVRIRAIDSAGEWSRGIVVLLSGNGKSLGLLMGDPIRSPTGLWLGSGLPMKIEGGHLYDLIDNEYEMEVLERDSGLDAGL